MTCPKCESDCKLTQLYRHSDCNERVMVCKVCHYEFKTYEVEEDWLNCFVNTKRAMQRKNTGPTGKWSRKYTKNG